LAVQLSEKLTGTQKKTIQIVADLYRFLYGHQNN
jgi:hypothetical protein